MMTAMAVSACAEFGSGDEEERNTEETEADLCKASRELEANAQRSV